VSTTTAATTPLPTGRRFSDRFGDRALVAVSGLASIAAMALIVLIVYRIVDNARPALSSQGLGFLGHQAWNGSTIFGAATLIYGTLVTTVGALLFAAPLGIAIGLYLSLLTSSRIAGVIGPLVELLAAVPSVIIGLWGIVVLDPVMRSTIEPALHNVLGFIPLFGAPSLSGAGIFTAMIILAIMALPIIAATSSSRSRRSSRTARLRSARRSGRWCAASCSRRCAPASSRRASSVRDERSARRLRWCR
jgi:phosphate transport system permease protein